MFEGTVAVVEEEVVVKLKDYGDDVPCCKSCHHPPHSHGHDTIEKECVVRTNYITKLTAKYRPDYVSRRPERPARRKGFAAIRNECLRKCILFVDDNFPPTNQSISFNGGTNRQYEWRRPHELTPHPKFFVEGATRFDIQQGELGDCWLLAAVSTLTLNPRLFHVVVPCDQSFDYKYIGIFHFRFWQYGKWEDVYVDDLLPSYKGSLVFMHSKTPNEYWCALLEKAYAKLYGCYESLKGGNISESMIDLTGGVVQSLNLKENPKNLFNVMRSASNRNALMGCGIEPTDRRAPPEGRLSNGLITRHAYSVTKVAYVPFDTGKVELVRLHNPWGNDAEWKGAWSDQSREWKSISPSDKLRLGITFDDDGEFWMPFENFASIFTILDICDITPEVFARDNDQGLDEDDKPMTEEEKRMFWKMKLHDGEWMPGKSAGGCRNFLESFSTNPQFVVLLDDPAEGREECTLVVSLLQKNVRKMKRFGADFNPIGFAIYRLPPGRIPGRQLDVDFFKYNATAGRAPFFLNTREVAHHFRLPQGVYVIVPSTFQPDCKGQFMLRVFTEGKRYFQRC